MSRMRAARRVLAGVPFAALVVLCVGCSPSSAANSRWNEEDPSPLSWSTPERVYAAGDVQTKGYAYAPSAVLDGDRTHVFTCHSRASGEIRDEIFETVVAGGSVVSSKSVLSGSSSWDSFHACDPTVVRVDGSYAGHVYRYALFYLGNDLDASAHNQIGVAFADELAGPWVAATQPVVGFTGESTQEWGAGQPTAVTLDVASGRVLLAWTEGYSLGTRPMIAEVDLSSDMPTIDEPTPLPVGGLSSPGKYEVVNNFDLVYAAAADRFLLVRDGKPNPTDSPSYIADHVQVASISAQDIRSAGGRWHVEGTIGAEFLGKPRVHNAGFVRTETGGLPQDGAVTVIVTTAELDPDSLFTYALWSTTASLG